MITNYYVSFWGKIDKNKNLITLGHFKLGYLVYVQIQSLKHWNLTNEID